jgi:squalene-hopene/tetraprenyl-beta-curcumene cyclase
MKAAVVIVTALATAICVLAEPASKVNADRANQRADQAMQEGLDWLKRLQKENGSWSNENFPAMTALGLWAFTRSDHPDKQSVCEKAAKFIAGFAQEDGGIYKVATGGRGSGGLSTYNTALCMMALHAYDRGTYAPLILKAREFMAHSQLVGDSDDAGGFGYSHKDPTALRTVMMKLMRRDRADLSNTGWAVQAMRNTQDVEDLRTEGKPVDLDWDATLKFLAKLQNQDTEDPVNYGSFGYEKGGARGGTFTSKTDGTVKLRGYGSMTYAGLEAMIYAQVDRTDPRVRSAIDWAARHWTVEENPGMGLRGMFYYLNIMSKALSLNGTDELTAPDGSKVRWKQDLIEKLIATQRPNGSWVNTDGQFWEGDPMLVTAYSILALEYALGK